MKRCPCCQSFYPNDRVFCEICGTESHPVPLERNETTDCGQSSEDADEGIYEGEGRS